MQVLTRGFLLSDAREKGGHPGRRERERGSLRMRPRLWQESFVPEPSSHANSLLNLSVTSDVAQLQRITK